jgi:ribose-phosphate pyrophosphokinase
MVSTFSSALGLNLAFVAKRRISASETEALHVIGEVEGKNVLLIDDMTETAGTLVSAASLLKKHGAQEIRACVSHGILHKLAYERLAESPISELICTNSTPVAASENPKVNVLSIAKLLGQAMKRIHRAESVTDLFRIDGSKII